ncbi:MAG: universal stress protein [Cytophagaceae bacterium]|nr:universal stress protein [Cytophagaceae bacterium]MBK9510835.1 universal stress protein [Cytophagaceae bacterium]MBK9934680.1 universal stress protein [Cytophagaceae bacterium]MBL0301117.1 universal stress protein [Cytophagaceae bacterium]MBL0323935.1 universal stress protein [Cytophagaceae bacterium]
MKKILVPTDMSHLANHALEVAVSLAKKFDGKIDLLNVKVYPTADVGAYYSLYGASGISIDDAWNQIMTEAKTEMQELISNFSGVDIKPIVEETGDHFVEAVLEHNADLIVMGSHGAEGFKEFFKGSNSEEVVRMANCPVLVLKDEAKPFQPKKVVFAVDLKHEDFIKKALKLLPIEGAECHFLYVDYGMKAINYHETEAQLVKLAEKLGIKNYKAEIYNSTTIEDGILEYSDSIGADLIAMYTHGRTGINHFFKGSIAEDVVNHSKIPVFTYVES